jgi:hypothetical protein|tara:strand:- start:147 stop:437 length:291 start_codon:yes stop_codon:yes gene_type:complete
MKIRDLIEGPGWDAFKKGAGAGFDKFNKGLGKASGRDMTVEPATGTDIAGPTKAGWTGKAAEPKDDKTKEVDLEKQNALLKKQILILQKQLKKLEG